MATLVDLPFQQDDSIYVQTDWEKLNFFFYNDEAQTEPTDFSGSTFTGEILDKQGGTKLFDLTFNTPANDGNIWPKLDDADTTTLTGRTVWFWVTVTTGALIEPYFYGELTVSSAFVAGA